MLASYNTHINPPGPVLFTAQEKPQKVYLQLHTIKVSKGAKITEESIQSSTTPDPGYRWESNKLTVRHHNREPRGQPFPSR